LVGGCAEGAFLDLLLRRVASNSEKGYGMAMKKKATSKRVSLSEEQFYAIARALGDARRLEIVQQVAASEGMECSALDVHEKLSPATVSHHMKELSEVGLVEIKRAGRSANLFLCRAVFDAYVRRLASL
jgi:ArsR family transcriptional regulator, arsenate/arsenite/antimonite-responsive transcriptional repressor